MIMVSNAHRQTLDTLARLSNFILLDIPASSLGLRNYSQDFLDHYSHYIAKRAIFVHFLY
jgi:hypothetical protein